MLTVDGLRADYVDRWLGQMTGGLGRLFREGAYFPVAVHDHAITATAPGHATIGSGRFPGSTGIRSNAEGVGSRSFPLIAGIGIGAGPEDFRGTTLADWMIAHDRRTRVFSASYKDRAAILPVGRSAANVYWYSGGGLFTTSTYYRQELPAWVDSFNARGLPREYAGRTWTLLLPESEYPEPDSVPTENLGGGFAFPHTADDLPRYVPTLLRATPWADELTLQFALAGVRALDIGTGPQVDFMSVSLSGTDLVGHTYGPDSREVHDQIMRLDRKLGEFLDSLFAIVGEQRVLIALTGDHGFASLGAAPARPGIADVFRISTTALLAPIRAGLTKRDIDPFAVQIDFGMVHVDREALIRAGIDPDSLVREVATRALSTPGIERADRPSDLAKVDTIGDHVARRWVHTLGSEHTVPLVLTTKYGSFWSGTGDANHGSPHSYDVQVPLLFHGRPFVQRRISDQVRVVDLAPTIARALGVTPMERLDGVTLNAALR
ncbi:MAG: alkaline phosphatase family protein [Gemmatimonadaceae bacterium]